MTRPAVLVTGGAKRVGRSICEAFGAAGWHVVVHYRSSDKAAHEVAASLPSAQTIQCDLTDDNALAGMVAELSRELDDWRACIASAAIFEPDEADALDANVFARSMATNARAPAQLAQAYLAKARAKGPRCMIDILDQKLENPNPDFFSYTMSKHALASTVDMLAKHHAGTDARIYGLAPGAILPSHDQSAAETEVSHRLNLLRRKTNATEVAQGCLFLAQGHLASGQVVFVDSGQHLLDQPRDVIYLAREGETACP